MFLKIARLINVEDVEAAALQPLDDQKIDAAIRELEDRSYVMRHPWLTGIPTLGIAPLVVKEKKLGKLVSKILRENPGAFEEYRKRLAENRAYEAELTRANAIPNAAANLAFGAIGTAEALRRRRE
jgi:hypothetical protein